MTEETKVKEKKPKVPAYIRPKKILELWNNGVKDVNEIAAQLMEFEKTVKLKNNIKIARDLPFYIRNTKWALTDATRNGIITDYSYARRPSRKGVLYRKAVTTEQASAVTPSEESLIPTL